jgi:hypothetical protein
LKIFDEIKLVFVFLASNPKVLVPGLLAALMQVLKGLGLPICTAEQLASITDGLTWIFGAVGLYYSFKAQWPPKAQGPPKQ